MQGSGAMVLVVEDEERLRAILVRALVGLGYTVAAVPTAEVALADDLAFGADIVLTDVRLPGMDGFTFGNLVRARRPEARIIYMSGQFTDDDVERAKLASAHTLLQKPFTIQTLTGEIRRLLES